VRPSGVGRCGKRNAQVCEEALRRRSRSNSKSHRHAGAATSTAGRSVATCTASGSAVSSSRTGARTSIIGGSSGDVLRRTQQQKLQQQQQQQHHHLHEAEVLAVSPDGRGVILRFLSDGAMQTVPRSWVHEVRDGDDVAIVDLDECVRRAHAAIRSEANFWQGLDQVATLPCAQLLAAGRAEVEARAAATAALQGARARHTALTAELEDEEEALAPERSRDPAVKALLLAAEAHLDAADALQDALQAVQRARIRGRPLEPLEEKAEAAKDGAKQADAEVRKAMLGLAEAMRRFPEVGGDPAVLKHLRISLPVDLVPLWCMGRTLGHFDNRELLPGASKHRLYRVMEGNKAFAVKEYAVVGGRDGLRVCLHEAALLTRARHPHIAEMVAIFADPEEHGFFIQMPFYEQGSLDKWAEQNRPDDLSLRRVLAQVVTALAHLHGLGIVHADIKPGNILIDGRGIARLGDFDISVDSGTRTSAARAHATMTQVGFTPGFAAPELLRTGASSASDIYAFGATIAEVAPAHVERDSLLRRLQAENPSERPTAHEVLDDPYFAPVFVWARDERRACCICLEDGIRLEEGKECGRTDGPPHFVCRDCLGQHVQATVGSELRLRQATEGRVQCPGRPCDSAPYPDVDLAQSVSSEVFRRYTESRLDLLEQRRAAELEGEMQARLGAELRRLQALDEKQRRVRAVRNQIVEDILTLKCPRCGQAFLDFVGCFALQCSRCPCGFCAWCGADSGGSNAHEHVRNCREKPPGADVFFGTFEQFEAAQRRRRRRLLRNFLPTLDREIAIAVLQEMRRDLGDLGLGDAANFLQQPQPPPPAAAAAPPPPQPPPPQPPPAVPAPAQPLLQQQQQQQPPVAPQPLQQPPLQPPPPQQPLHHQHHHHAAGHHHQHHGVAAHHAAAAHHVAAAHAAAGFHAAAHHAAAHRAAAHHAVAAHAAAAAPPPHGGHPGVGHHGHAAAAAAHHAAAHPVGYPQLAAHAAAAHAAAAHAAAAHLAGGM